MENATVINTAEGIDFYRLAALKGAVKMEVLGMKRRGRSACAIAKEQYGLKGSKQKVLEQLEAMVAERLGEQA